MNNRFPVPIYSAEMHNKAFQPRFLEVFDELKAQGQFQYKNEWQSHLLSDPSFDSNLIKDYAIDAFTKELHFHVLEYLDQAGFQYPLTTLNYTMISSWMTLYNKRDYAHVHSHGMTDISGVYYVKTDGSDGNLYFPNPMKAMANSYCFRHFYPEWAQVKPKVGTLVLFPGWLEHGVLSNCTDNERVSVSFNLLVDRRV